MYACHGGCVLNETAIGIRHAQSLVAAAQTSRTRAAAAADLSKPPSSSKRDAAPTKQQLRAALPFGSGCKIAVVDIDVHFGDGTALCFYDDPTVRDAAHTTTSLTTHSCPSCLTASSRCAHVVALHRH